MENKLQIFNNSSFGNIRILQESNKVLFCANDVARALGYANPQKATRDHCKGATKRSGVSTTTNQHGIATAQTCGMNFIPEGDVYRLITRSKLPTAEKFEHWLFDEVVPSVVNTGSYGQPVICSHADRRAGPQPWRRPSLSAIGARVSRRAVAAV